jgi:Secretion system C-terminal sorting domain
LANYVITQNNFLHPKEIGRIINVGDRLAENRIESEGWFNSETGSYLPDPTIAGTLSFNMNLHNIKHPNSAQGVVKIIFPAANINITGNEVECLLIDENKVIIRGEGRNTGKGNFGFLVKAVDGGSSGDLINITIWDKLEGDKVIHDNLTLNELGGGYIKILLSEFAKEDNELLSPDKFKLEQNYPNPFNPSTTIKYSVPTQEYVQLKVYDLIGNEVATLVNETKAPGIYETMFNATQLASGIYIYALRAGSFTQTKKMILMK